MSIGDREQRAVGKLPSTWLSFLHNLKAWWTRAPARTIISGAFSSVDADKTPRPSRETLRTNPTPSSIFFSRTFEWVRAEEMTSGWPQNQSMASERYDLIRPNFLSTRKGAVQCDTHVRASQIDRQFLALREETIVFFHFQSRKTVLKTNQILCLFTKSCPMQNILFKLPFFQCSLKVKKVFFILFSFFKLCFVSDFLCLFIFRLLFVYFFKFCFHYFFVCFVCCHWWLLLFFSISQFKNERQFWFTIDYYLFTLIKRWISLFWPVEKWFAKIVRAIWNILNHLLWMQHWQKIETKRDWKWYNVQFVRVDNCLIGKIKNKWVRNDDLMTGSK